ncbi:MAG: hypothetical protein Q4C47_03010 [Planctomycetia bacterium]|nr:hypothetical protein [Planctomycetia bacterium]
MGWEKNGVNIVKVSVLWGCILILPPGTTTAAGLTSANSGETCSVRTDSMERTSTDMEALRRMFAEPTAGFRVIPILHSSPIDRDQLHWLQERHAGGLVVDVGVVPGSSGVSGSGEVHCNPTYLTRPERFAKLGEEMARMKREGLQTWIYDELAYPSGNAGGRVLDGHPEFQAQVLTAHMRRCATGETVQIPEVQGKRLVACALPIVSEHETSSYHPIFNGVVVSLERAVRLELTPGKGTWTAPMDDPADEDVNGNTSWIICILEQNASTAWERHDIRRRNVNIMDRRAVARFIEQTHQRYAGTLGEQIRDVEYFFTDEPQLGASDYWGGNGLPECPPSVAWCEEFPEAFASRYPDVYGGDVFAILPAIFLNVGPQTAGYRYAVYDVLSALIAENYFGQIQEWCHRHGTRSTGHMLLEESLLFHLMFTGSLCRNFRRMDLPGVDLLVTPRYRTMPGWAFEVYPEDYSCKLASSISYLTGGDGVFTESFALAAKETPVRQTLGVAAWQIACGVTHFTTYSVQNSFSADDYATLSDFVGRSLTLCRRGEHAADVAILIPEHSVWATFNPVNGGTFGRYQNCNPEAMMIDSVFRDTCHAFSRRQRDFDIVDEELLETATVGNDGRIAIGMEKRRQMFRCLVIPEARMISPRTVSLIREFADAGGIVVFAGTLPEMTPYRGCDPTVRQEVQNIIDEHPDTIIHQELTGVRKFTANRPEEDIAENRERLDRVVTWIADRVPPEFTWNGAEGVRILRRMDGDLWILYLANPSTTEAAGTLEVRASGKIAFWNPETGEVTEAEPITPEFPVSVVIPPESARCVTIEP